jgi:hypothetical protein
MKKKVRKFASGGDILTALGAGLAGYGAYKYLTRDKGESKDDDYTRKVKEFGRKGRFPEDQTEEKANAKKAEAKVADDRDEARERALRQSKDPKSNLVPEGADRDALYESDKALVRTDKKGAPVKKAVNKTAVKKAVDKSTDKSVNKLVDKPAGDVSSSPVFKRADEKVDKGPAPNPPVSRFVRPPDIVGQATEKKIEQNKEASKDRQSKAFPINKAADEKAIQKAGGVRVDNSLPKGIDTKGTNKTVYGTDTTSVFQRKATQEREEKAKAEAEAEKKRRNRPSSEEMMTQSLGGGFKRGGAIKASKMGSVKTAKPTMRSASARADGIAIRGKTRA